jgi:TetR/AcrR family transcriptional regulator
MPRNSKQNESVRESRKHQILDAALSVYVRLGYYGTDMDTVANEAHLAKGLVYYYYNSKQQMFIELYTWMFNEGFIFSETLLQNSSGMKPIEQLMYYTYNMLGANNSNPRMMKFFIRAPFDAHAILGTEQCKKIALQSHMHRNALSQIIQNGIEQKEIPLVDAMNAANSFWTVFVANMFEYSKLIEGSIETLKNKNEVFKEVVRFCFQGLGIKTSCWNACLQKVLAENQKEETINESI